MLILGGSAYNPFNTIEFGETLESLSFFFLIGGAILLISLVLPFNPLRKARMVLGVLCFMGAIAIYVYLTYFFDPDYFGKDGPAESIMLCTRTLLMG